MENSEINSNKNEKNWCNLNLLKYVYEEPLPKEYTESVNIEIEKGNLELMELILGLEAIQIRKKFVSAQEQWDWLEEKENEFINKFNGIE